jgi:hypothetical protein
VDYEWVFTPASVRLSKYSFIHQQHPHPWFDVHRRAASRYITGLADGPLSAHEPQQRDFLAVRVLAAAPQPVLAAVARGASRRGILDARLARERTRRPRMHA